MLVFLHTAQAPVGMFGALARELDDGIPVRHEVREELLASAVAAGTATSKAVARAVAGVLQTLAEDGARVILCTCSTLGALVEEASLPGCLVMRVDRAVAERAAASGQRIRVVAALPTALAETVALVRRVASTSGREPEIVEHLSAEAWPFFVAGDMDAYQAHVADLISTSALPGEVVLLAQASMAPAAARVARHDISILSSPRLGVAAALEAHRRASAGARPPGGGT